MSAEIEEELGVEADAVRQHLLLRETDEVGGGAATCSASSDAEGVGDSRWRPKWVLSLVIVGCAASLSIACLARIWSPVAAEPLASLVTLSDMAAMDQCAQAVHADPFAVNVVSYNMYWWCVSDKYHKCPKNAHGKGFEMAYERLRANHPFDLVGFQECDNPWQVISHVGYDGCFEAYQPHADSPIAWNKFKFRFISSGHEYIARDRYGNRFMNWVRLSVLATGGTILFANTHGPLLECNGRLGKHIGTEYANIIASKRQPGDAVIFTGDFNCGLHTEVVKILSQTLALDVDDFSYGGSDHVLSSGLQVLWKGALEGAPSDHQLVKATYQLPTNATDATMGI